MLTYKTLIFEALGTFTITYNIMLAGESDAEGHSRDTTRAALIRGIILAVFIYLGAKLGIRGFFNPTVSFSMMIIGRMSLKNCAFHVIVQTIAGILGACTCFLLRPAPIDEFKVGSYNRVNPKTGLMSAVLAEAITTFVFVLTLFQARVSRKTLPIHAAIICGMSTIVPKFAFSEATGGGVNPLGAFGPGLIDGKPFARGWWTFWVGGLIGASAGAWFSHIFLGDMDPNKFLENAETGFKRDVTEKKHKRPTGEEEAESLVPNLLEPKTPKETIDQPKPQAVRITKNEPRPSNQGAVHWD